MTVKTDLANGIIAALKAHEEAKSSTASEDKRTLTDLIGGVRKGADNYPAKRNETDAAYAMEAVRVAGLEVGRADRVSRRKKAARARSHRQAQIEALANAKDTPTQERVDAAWGVITPLFPVIDSVAGRKRRWMQRYLGDLTADITTESVEAMLMVLARSSMDMDVLRESAEAIISKEAAPVLPADATEEQRKHRKAVSKGCSWLMGVVNNMVMRSIDAAYNSDENLRWQNLDILDTMMSSANGPQEDAYIARFKADRAPKMSGWRWAQPGEFDPSLLSAAIDAAITDRRLDALVEVFIGEGNTHPNGTFKWEQLAQRVFEASPGDGEWMWALVLRNTKDLAHPEKAQARAAKLWTAKVFAWLPGFIVEAARALPDLPYGDGKRYPLAPALSYATAADAAAAISEVIE